MLGNLSEGTRAYRAESGIRREEVEIPFGEYEKHLLYDEAVAVGLGILEPG